MCQDDIVKEFISVNIYNDEWFYSKENFDELLDWISSILIFICAKELWIDTINNNKDYEFEDKIILKIKRIFKIINTVKDLSLKSEYKLEILKQKLSKYLPV